MSISVSVVMAAFNGERFLQPQLESILKCLRDADELIVVDDCSSDQTPQILAALCWPNLVVIRNDVNLGVRKSFEVGLRRATGEVVFLSDQDDVWLPGKRDAFVAEFEARPLCTVVISDAQVIDADGRVILRSFMETRGGFRAGLVSNFIRNRFLGCAMAVRRTVTQVAVPIPRSVPMHDMWLGMIGGLIGQVRYLEQPYLMYRRHGRNLSPATRGGWRQILWWRLKLLFALAQGLSRPAFWRAVRLARVAGLTRGRS